ncbi:MAG: hypothetical protein CMN34_06935 [Saprospirales bacterium]|nr:hypothetical protein [Saprospirales bacterium]
MVVDCLKQLFQGSPLPEKTLTELEHWAEQHPYHLSPSLIRLWNERLGGPLEYDESQLNRLAFFMADRGQLFALVKGEGIPAENSTALRDKEKVNRDDSIAERAPSKPPIPTFDLHDTMSSPDTEISSLGDFLASLAVEVPIQARPASAMDGDLEAVLRSEDIQAIIQRSKIKKTENTTKEFVSETYATILRSQGRYEEAIQVYSQLMLENPKKKRFFADQIDELLKK